MTSSPQKITKPDSSAQRITGRLRCGFTPLQPVRSRWCEFLSVPRSAWLQPCGILLTALQANTEHWQSYWGYCNKNKVTSVCNYKSWSLAFPHFIFCIADVFTPPMKHWSTLTRVLCCCANTIQKTFFPCHFLLLKHFCYTWELRMFPGLWYIVIFSLQRSCYPCYSLSNWILYWLKVQAD